MCGQIFHDIFNLMEKLINIKGLLIDLEGVLYTDNKLISGSIKLDREYLPELIIVKLRFTSFWE